MVAHLDAVTSLAVDPNGIYLMSGSKHFFIFCIQYKFCIYDALKCLTNLCLFSFFSSLSFLFFFPKQAMIVPLGYGIWTARHVCKK